MDETKRKKLEDAGWKVGDADEFLTDQCEHEWHLDMVKSGYYCAVLGCNETLLLHEAIAKLNEHAEQKQEIERLRKIERKAKLYLEHGEPELADELAALLEGGEQ